MKQKRIFTQILSCFLCVTFVLQFFLTQVSATDIKEDHNNYETWLQTIYSSKDGLSVGKANAIATTKDGLIWIGTYAGLYRYNGAKFQLMSHYERVKSVECLFVDNEDRLWVGSNDNGVSVYQNEELVGVVDGLPSDSIRSIVQCAKGHYFIGTSEGLAIVDFDDSPKVKKVIDEMTYVESMSADKTGLVAAISTNNTMYLLDKGQIIDRVSLPGDDRYTSCVFDESGHVYVGTSSGNMHIYDVSQKTFKEYNRLHCGSLRKINNLIRVNESTIFVCADNGIGYFDAANTFHQLRTPNYTSNIYDVILDCQGNLWFASSRMGLLRLCKTSFNELFPEYSVNPSVVNTITRYQDNLYIGTDTGLIIIDEKNHRRITNELTDNFAGMRIRQIYKDSRNALWFCTYGSGLVQYDGTTLKKYSLEKDNIGYRVRTILERKNGDMVVSSATGISIIRNGAVVKTYGSAEGLKNNVNLCLFEQEDGTLLVGNDGSGIVKIVGDQISYLGKEAGLPSGVILRMVKDEGGTGIFVVTSSALCYMQKNGSIKVLHNFPYSNNYDLLQKGEHVFVLGSAGIYSVLRSELISDNEKMKVIFLDHRSGLKEALVANSWPLAEKDSNKVYLATSAGVTSFDINAYGKRPMDFQIRLAELIADGERMPVEKGNSFTFSKKVSRVEIKPEIINYSTVDPIISCYLEGVDKEPIVMTQSELSSIVYTNLKPGKYTFRINLVDQQSGVSISERAYYMEKETSFTDTIWYYVLLVVGLALVLSWIIIYLSRRLYKQNMRKKDEELAHTMQLSITDELTKLRNRLSLREEYPNYVGRFLTITMLDIDYFKWYNDTYGHDAGDKVLRAVGEVLLTNCQEHGVAYRYGGDEFLILDFSATAEQAAEHIAKMVEAIHQITISECADPISISYGSASGTPRSLGELRSLQIDADKNLYKAKENRAE